MESENILGIDVGATGIKGAIVNPKTGALITERIKIKTPKPATPDAILAVIRELKRKLKFTGDKIGIGFPSVVKNGTVLSAANIDKSWINYPIVEKYSKALRKEVYVINDADAAGLAEMKFGKGKKKKGLVIFLTLGTGIGSAPFKDGKLLANTEFGHLKYKESVAEKYASNSARELKKQSWKVWAGELNTYLKMIDFYLSPDLFIIGGGVSKDFISYKRYITLKTPVEPASLQNAAGVIGAAMAADARMII
ncbi:MAG: ROK family protein [Saprospiraceae bacterium]|nr:ROK family protein [Saprospiraceae bacterium]